MEFNYDLTAARVNHLSDYYSKAKGDNKFFYGFRLDMMKQFVCKNKIFNDYLEFSMFNLKKIKILTAGHIIDFIKKVTKNKEMKKNIIINLCYNLIDDNIIEEDIIEKLNKMNNPFNVIFFYPHNFEIDKLKPIKKAVWVKSEVPIGEKIYMKYRTGIPLREFIIENIGTEKITLKRDNLIHKEDMSKYHGVYDFYYSEEEAEFEKYQSEKLRTLKNKIIDYIEKHSTIKDLNEFELLLIEQGVFDEL